MIVQIKNDNTQYIYTHDASRDYLDVAKALGLTTGAGLASYVTSSPIEYTNANGAKVKAVRLTGYSNLSYYVMNDTVTLDIKHKGNLTKDMFKTILDGLNFFENARIKLGDKVYLAPFRALNYATMNTITDAAGNHIMLSSSQVRDVEAILVLCIAITQQTMSCQSIDIARIAEDSNLVYVQMRSQVVEVHTSRTFFHADTEEYGLAFGNAIHF